MLERPPEHVRKAIALVHEDLTKTYYGCGLVFPEVVQGMRILDLGSGTGRDCFVLSKLVGEKGSVVGVDMTDEQLALANKHIEYHTKAFGTLSTAFYSALTRVQAIPPRT